VGINQTKSITQKLTLTNFSDEAQSLSFKGDFTQGLSVKEFSDTLAPQESKSFDIEFTITPQAVLHSQLEGYLKVIGAAGEVLATFPALAVVHEFSEIALNITENDPQDITVDIKNPSTVAGKILPFYLLGRDPQKPSAGTLSNIRSTACDLESAGFRFLEKSVGLTQKTYLQIGVKLYDRVSDWESCEISVQIDKTGNGESDLEWVALRSTSLPGLKRQVPEGFYSLLLDAKKARELRSDFETTQRTNPNDDEEDYRSALLYAGDYRPYHQSTVTMMEIPLEALQLTGDLKLKLAVLNSNQNSIMPDDFLGNDWMSVIVPKDPDNWPEVIEVKAQESLILDISKIMAIDMIFYSPTNNVPFQDIAAQ
jgi:minor extracellular serine protease Vpr